MEFQDNFTDALASQFESLRLETYGRERVYFGLGDYQGKRLLIQVPVYFSEIPVLFSSVNRPRIAGRVQEIKDYILRRVQSNRAWILGGLTANVNPDDIQLFPLGSKLYIVRIPNGTSLHVTDGQHRMQAIAELMAIDEHRCLLNNEQIPLTLILDSDVDRASVDFRDMQHAIALPPALLVRFSSEGRDGIARSLVDKVPLFQHTEIANASPGTGTKNIYAINYIAGLVGCAIAGDPNAELLEYNTQNLVEKEAERLSSWLNRFFSCCPCTIPLLALTELTVADVATFKSSSLLGISVGLEILGHFINRGGATPEQLATEINWLKTNTLWTHIMTSHNGGTSKQRVKSVGGAIASQVADAALKQVGSRKSEVGSEEGA